MVECCLYGIFASPFTQKPFISLQEERKVRNISVFFLCFLNIILVSYVIFTALVNAIIIFNKIYVKTFQTASNNLYKSFPFHSSFICFFVSHRYPSSKLFLLSDISYSPVYYPSGTSHFIKIPLFFIHKNRESQAILINVK